MKDTTIKLSTSAGEVQVNHLVGQSRGPPSQVPQHHPTRVCRAAGSEHLRIHQRQLEALGSIKPVKHQNNRRGAEQVVNTTVGILTQ